MTRSLPCGCTRHQDDGGEWHAVPCRKHEPTNEYCYHCAEVIDPDAPDTVLMGKFGDEYAHKGCVAKHGAQPVPSEATADSGCGSDAAARADRHND